MIDMNIYTACPNGTRTEAAGEIQKYRRESMSVFGETHSDMTVQQI